MTVMLMDGVDVTDAVADLAMVRGNLKRGLDAMKAKRPFIDLAWRYYDGDHPALWLTEKLADVFGTRLASNLANNYCEVAVDAVLHRLAVTGWADRLAPGTTEQQDNASTTPESGPAAPDTPERDVPPPDVAPVVTDAMLAERVWADNDLDLEQEDLYRHAQVAGEGYVIVWPSDDGGMDVVVNDPRSVHVEYGSLRRTDVRWAVKAWFDQDVARWRANVYFPERIVRLIGPITSTNSTDEPAAHTFVLDADDPGGPHPFGKVPVIPFNRRRNAPSRLRSLWPIQDKINKLAANKMVAAEFGAFRQRYVLSTQEFADGTLQNSPDHAWLLDPGTPDAPTKVGEFAITELSNYDESINAEVEHFFAVAGLPRHLRQGAGGAPPSGDAVRADEGPFVALVDSYVKRFGAAWRDVMDLIGLNVEPAWAETEVNNDKGTAETVKTYVDAGAPLTVALRKYAGWDDSDLAEVEAKQASDAERAEQAAAAAGMLAMQSFGAMTADAENPLQANDTR